MTDMGLGSWPLRRARMTPDATALRQGDRALTYAQLAERVDALANGLQARGVRAGDRVAYLGANDIATFETFFATGRLGAVFVPLNTRLAPAEISFMLSDCGASVLVHGAEAAGLVAAADPWGNGISTVLALPDELDALVAENAGRLLRTASVAQSDNALILYTSGTTGDPKGAVLTHANLTCNTMNQLAHVDVLQSDIALCTAPLFHVTGLGQVTLPVLFKGGTIVVAPKFDPSWMLPNIASFGITAFSAVPTMLQMLCDHPEFAAADLSSLRYVIYGGSPVLERVARAWMARGVTILQGYGMTEASPGVLMALPDGAAERPTSAGVPHFFTDIALMDPLGAVVVGEGTGELLVHGPNVFTHYWNRTDDVGDFAGSGWYRTGDVARVDPDGWAYIVDRVKDVIISGGENIYPAEVEAALADLPGLRECALVGVPDDQWGEVGLVYIVCQEGTSIDAESVRHHLEGRLARYKIPRHVRLLSELPRTATGKLRRDTLRSVPDPLTESGHA